MCLKLQSCKLYNNKYMIASTQIANTGIFAFIAVLFKKILSLKVLFINRKDNRNNRRQISRVNYCKIINSWNTKFSGYFWETLAIINHCFFSLYDCTFKDSISLVLTLNRTSSCGFTCTKNLYTDLRITCKHLQHLLAYITHICVKHTLCVKHTCEIKEFRPLVYKQQNCITFYWYFYAEWNGKQLLTFFTYICFFKSKLIHCQKDGCYINVMSLNKTVLTKFFSEMVVYSHDG